MTTTAVETHAGEHVHRDDYGSKMGMWLFLFTELILFGGLFVIYAVYRFSHQAEFELGSKELDTLVGTINTMVLLTSSLTVAMSITAIQRGNKKLSLLLVGITIALALVFLVNKYFEWSHKFAVGLYPQSPELLAKPPGEILYFGLYFVMTGLHALHVIIGAIVLAVDMRFMQRDIITKDSYVKLEALALHRPLVSILCTTLFPLFYLVH